MISLDQDESEGISYTLIYQSLIFTSHSFWFLKMRAWPLLFSENFFWKTLILCLVVGRLGNILVVKITYSTTCSIFRVKNNCPRNITTTNFRQRKKSFHLCRPCQKLGLLSKSSLKPLRACVLDFPALVFLSSARFKYHEPYQEKMSIHCPRSIDRNAPRLVPVQYLFLVALSWT